jgi:hypothetical protein
MGESEERNSEHSSQFNILRELRDWIPTLPTWRQLAAKCLLVDGEIDQDSFDQIYRILLEENGFLKPSTESQAIDVSLPDLPEAVASEQLQTLLSIEHVKGVNALATNEVLRFGNNLTVVYGQNATGKSGFARILMDSCFIRSKKRRLLGDVKKPSTGSASAILNFQGGDESNDYQWSQGTPCPMLRDAYAVFDNEAVRIHTDQQNRFMVTPYGFSVFSGLVELDNRLKKRLKDEVANRTPDLSAFRTLQGTTKVSTLLTNLSASTPEKSIRELGKFDETSQGKLTKLEENITRLKSTDPLAHIKTNSDFIADLERCVQVVQSKAATFQSFELDSVKTKLHERDECRATVAAQSLEAFAAEPIAPLGSDVWLRLIGSAIAFSMEHYEQVAFPADVEDPRCVLCQQPLSEEANKRLASFWHHLQGTAKKRLEVLELEISNLSQQLLNFDTTIVSDTDRLRDTLVARYPDVLSKLDSLSKSWAKARAVIASNLKSDAEWKTLPLLKSSPEQKVRELIGKLQKENTDLSAGAKGFNERLTQLNQTKLELEHRRFLAASLESVVKAWNQLRWIDRVEKLTKGLGTARITTKSKELYKQLVANQYVTRFRDELDNLGFREHIDIDIKGESGGTSRKLAYGLIKNIAPSEVFSEGEQKVVALADFLAEVSCAPNIRGVVFDDPVNSLDHGRKELIAKRLVKEAEERQVIIFTHDVMFTYYLADASRGKRAGFFMGKTVSRGYGERSPGLIDHTPFPNSFYDDLGLEQAEACLVRGMEKQGDELKRELTLACSFLRTAYEDFIQGTVFNDVIDRWRENIKAFNLPDMYFDAELIKEITARMAELSRYIPAHSHTKIFHEVPESADIVVSEIAAYKRIKKEYARKLHEHKSAQRATDKAPFVQ